MTNPVLEAKINDIHSWWEVPCIAHFCSLFRASFNLIDFDIEDLEEALLTDDASDSGNTLIQELIVRLLRGYYGNNSISTFNYQMFLRRLFRQKCREFDCYNPFDSDMDFQFLPMRTKVEILHMLCDFRLDADDVLEILKDLDSDSLRVHPLGYDANKSAYWYFYGTRLYREDYPKKKKEKEKKRGRKRKRGRNKEEDSDEGEVELGSGVWQVVCFTESDWERLAVNTEDATDKNEQTLHQIIEEDFLPEIPKLFQEKERLQRKRFLELHPRKSSRIENLKRRKEEEVQYLEKYKKTVSLEGSESEADSENCAKRAKNARYERWKNRNQQKEGSFHSDDFSDSESFQDSVKSYNNQSGFIVGRGRQTNNSLSSVTGEIIINAAERNRSPEWFDTKLEDLHIGMYKVLNKLKDHADAWPFLEPVDEEDAPNYYKVVKSPMSLQRMEEKLDNGRYKTLKEFRHDFQLMLANCKQYNGSKNEYTLMGEKLEKVFNANVSRYITLNNSSDGEDVTENSDFLEFASSSDLRKKRKRRKRTNSKSTEEADKENERKLSTLDAVFSVNSLENETRSVEEVLGSDSRTGEQKPVKRGKGRPPKNSSTYDALEQTLRDITKWLDDTPKYTNYSSVSNSPPPSSNSPRSETTTVDVPPVAINEIAEPPKVLSKPAKTKDPSRKRPVKESSGVGVGNASKSAQLKKPRPRDIQRTIDRLQPGKSKGNLIATIGKASLTGKPNSNDKFAIGNSIKGKENSAKTSTTVTSENSHRPVPMLSLGSVLSHDVIALDTNTRRHTFSDNESPPSDNDDPLTDDETSAITASCSNAVDQNDVQAENLAPNRTIADVKNATADDKKDERLAENAECTTVCNETTKSSGSEKTEKPTPNLSAWFRAFGAPKTSSNVKRKSETTTVNDNPATPSVNDELKDDYAATMTKSTSSNANNKSSLDEDRYDPNEPPPPTPGRFYMYDEEREQRSAQYQQQQPLMLPSPDPKPSRRQRRLSTGSSVSERSSFSQDPNDPMNSPHPSLDDSVYQSPQPYAHQSPIHHSGGALKVGFYQDTFPKCGSDKSNSCSPREPMNGASPQHPMFSPRDSTASPVCSPRAVVTSPRESITSPRDAVGGGLQASSPRYPSSSPYSEPVQSPAPYVKSPAYTPENQLNTAVRSNSPFKAYKKDAYPASTEKTTPFSIYPVKKRISAELGQHETEGEKLQQLQQPPPPPLPPPLSSQPQHQPVAYASEQQQTPHFAPLMQSGHPPQPMIPPASFPPTSSADHTLLPHHHPPQYMDSYPDGMLLSSNPYLRPSAPPAVPTSSAMYITPNDGTAPPASSTAAAPETAYSRPLDFTPTSSPLPLTNKPELYASAYPKYPAPHPEVLNFSNKTPGVPQHPYYANAPKMENEYGPPPYGDKNNGPAAVVSSAHSVYHPNAVDLKQHIPPASYHPAGGTTSFSNVDYFGNCGKPNDGYPMPDPSRYPTYADNKQQYYGAPANVPKSHPSSMELLSSSVNPHPGNNFNQALSNIASDGQNAPMRYEGYQNVNRVMEPRPVAAPAPAPTTKTRKSRKKKTVAAHTPIDPTEQQRHYYLGNSAGIGQPVTSNLGGMPSDLKHNGLMAGGTFDFAGNGAPMVKNDYQPPYFGRYFGENVPEKGVVGSIPATSAAPPTSTQPVNNTASFPFLPQRSTPPFGLAPQTAFMSPNVPPCPSIYTSPYLQRPPDELLRPMMLPQGLMSAHSGTYPHGYLNMHDPMNRSPWL